MLKKWLVVRISHNREQEVVYFFDAPVKNSSDAFNMLSNDMQKQYEKGYAIKPYPKRLSIKREIVLTFDIPGLENENRLPLLVNEFVGGIGFEYSPDMETSGYLRKMVPVPVVRNLAEILTTIFKKLKVKPVTTVVQIKDANPLGDHGSGARGITSKERIAYFELELSSSPLSDLHFWEHILWHESRHVQYVLEGRFPSLWPWYKIGATPMWVIDDIVHFSIDGWLDRYNRPTIPYITDDPKVTDLKSFRVKQLKDDLTFFNYDVPDRAIWDIANELWSRETNIREVYQIALNLGLKFPDDTPIGKYFKSIS